MVTAATKTHVDTVPIPVPATTKTTAVPVAVAAPLPLLPPLLFLLPASRYCRLSLPPRASPLLLLSPYRFPAATAAVPAVTETHVDIVPISPLPPLLFLPLPPLPPLRFLLPSFRYCHISLPSHARLPRTTFFHAVIRFSVPAVTHPTRPT